MKKYLVFAMFVVLAVALVSPVSVSAKTKAGAKPGSFFYFFDKAIEKTSLFFTFNPEKKAKKVLENAEERLAEAEELKKEKEEKETIETKKEETKEIKTSEKDIEKTDNNLEEEESEETEIKDDKKEETNKKDEQSKEIEKLKKEVEALKQKTSQIKIVEKIVEKPVVIESKQSSSSQTKQKEVTLPNGAVVEMDENGNVVRTIKEAPQSIYVAPVSTIQTNTAAQTNISSSIASISSPKIKLSMISNSAKAVPSASNQIIAKFLVYSEDGNINSNKSILKLSISNGIGKTGDLSNFFLVDKNGTVVAGPVNPNNESVLIFTDTVTFPKGTMEYTLRGTVGDNFSNEQWIYASANTDNWTLKFTEEPKPNIQPFQASEMGVFVSSQVNQLDNNGIYIVNINLTSLTDLTSLFIKLVNKETGIEYQHNSQVRNLNNYSAIFTNIPSGNYNLKMIADATTLIGVVQTFISGILVQ